MSLENTLKQTSRLVARARLRLVWERYVPTLAPGFLAVAIFLLGAWMGLWQWIGDPVRFIALAATVFFLTRSLYRALPIPFPTRSDARRRVEADSGQAHRPLDVLDDRPALSADVWPSHQKAALQKAQLLRKAKSRPTLGPVDPAYLRFILPALLLGAAVYMAGFSFERLRNAVAPTWQSPIRSSAVTYEAWIDPPAYTGRPPLYFKDTTNISVPAGSEFVTRISGAKDAPRPRLQTGWRGRFLTPKRLGAKSFEIREIISDSSTVEFRVGLDRKIFTLNIMDDTPPEVEIVDPPEADKRDRLVLAYSLKDDFGVEKLELEMALLVEGFSEETAFEAETVLANIGLPGSKQTDVESASAALDLSKNRWAGKKVIGRLVATDGAGNQGLSAPAYFTIPDKIFVEPLAKAVAEQRSLVIAGLEKDYAPRPRPEWTAADGFLNENRPRLTFDRAPDEIKRATVLIEAVTDMPAGFFEDPAIYMGLRHARSTMRHADEVAMLRGLPEDLWKIAIRAEFGVLGTALEEMREAEEALREGIARRASKREIDTLFDRYNLAVEAYTEELRRQAQEDGNTAEGGGGEGGAMGNVDEIQELLKAIEEANAAGDTEGARKALAQLAELLENMEIQLSQGGGGGEGGEPSGGDMSEEMKENLEDLADLTGQQRDLQDETERAERNDQSEPGDEELTPEELAGRQAQIQDLLDQLDGAIPSQGENAQSGQGEESGEGEGQGQGQGTEPGGEQSGQQPGSGEQSGQSGDGTQPGDGQAGGGTEPGEGQGSGGRSTQDLQDQLTRGLGAAGQAMQRSQEALEGGDLRGAGDAQAEALQALRDAGEALAEAAIQQSGDGQDAQASGEGQDPLGRGTDGINDGNSEADLDDRDNATRSRELLEELRRRAAEQQREQEERDYLERLLKRF